MHMVMHTIHQLPCGCTLSQMYRVPSSGLCSAEWIDRGAQTLRYWTEIRASEHDCSLVSEDNPAGSKRRVSGTHDAVRKCQ